MESSLQVYQQLVISPERLAWCRQSASVPDLLRRLKVLWHQEKVTDAEMLAIVSGCNQQVLNVDVAQLAGHWLPYRYDARTRSLYWCLPDGHPSEPFHDEYVSGCRQRILLNQFIQPKTSLESLQSWSAAADDLIQPAGFIFHLSRCGSTLLSGCLSEFSHTCVLSESQLLTDVLLDNTLDSQNQAHLLPRLLHMQGCLIPARTNVIVKWNAWDIFCWSVLRQLYPQVAVVFLVRHPLEILASHHRQPGRHMAGDKTLQDLSPALAASPSTERMMDLRIQVLRALMNEILNPADEPGVMLVDYDELDEAKIAQIATHFGMTATPDDLFHIRRRMAVHSKQPNKPFQADGPGKQKEFSDGDREQAWYQLGPVYQQLVAKCSATPILQKSVGELLEQRALKAGSR